MIRFILNDKEEATHLPPGMLLIDYIRYHRHLKGTKIGCREGDCGACTVLVGELKEDRLTYLSATSCLMALANVAGKHIVTIEGLNGEGLSPVQQAISDEAATQCGFCTPGFVVSLSGFCLSDEEPNGENVIASINGNICRCTGYKSIERAAHLISVMMQKKGERAAIDFAIEKGILPAYFSGIKSRLEAMPTNGYLQSTSSEKRILGGGTDLYVQQPEAMVHTAVQAVTLQRGLSYIRQQDNRCLVGAATTVTDMVSSPVFQKHFPSIKKFIKLVSSTPIRNMATVAGNFVNASPIGDLTIFFLALDAKLVLDNGQENRTLSLSEFYKGYKQLDKNSDETVTEVFFDLPSDNSFFNFEKVSKRTHLDIASVNSAMLMEVKNNIIVKASISAGGVAPVPLLLKQASTFLLGKDMSEETVQEAIAIAQEEISPISDVRGSEAYKRLLLGQLIKAHFMQCFPHLSIEKLLAR